MLLQRKVRDRLMGGWVSGVYSYTVMVHERGDMHMGGA